MNPLSILTRVFPRIDPDPDDTVAGDPILPPELERYIFELSCTYDSLCAYNVLQVSKRTYEWIHHLLYHSLIFTDAAINASRKLPLSPLAKLVQSINPTNPSLTHRNILSHFKQYSRRLILALNPKAPAGTKILGLTPNLTHLIARDRSIHPSDEYIWNITSLPLQHLYFILGQFSPFLNYSLQNPGLRWASSLTHLIFYGSMTEDLDLTHFPNLTHFGSAKNSFEMTTVPLERPNFKVCVWFTIWSENTSEMKQEFAPYDPKVVFLSQRTIISPMAGSSNDSESWDGFDDMWRMAAEIVERQTISLSNALL